ncbi:MAG: hypothetical protein ACSHXW_07280 [Yoonia sp.]
MLGYITLLFDGTPIIPFLALSAFTALRFDNVVRIHNFDGITLERFGLGTSFGKVTGVTTLLVYQLFILGAVLKFGVFSALVWFATASVAGFILNVGYRAFIDRTNQAIGQIEAITLWILSAYLCYVAYVITTPLGILKFTSF